MKHATFLLLTGLVFAQAAPPPRLGVVVYEDEKDGVVVQSVVTSGPASVAGVRAGDRITRFGDFDVRRDADLVKALSGWRTGHTTSLGVVREGKTTTLKVVLGTPASFKEAGSALRRARALLEGHGDLPDIKRALVELDAANRVVEQLARVAVRRVPPRPAPDTARVRERIDRLLAQGRTPSEIEKLMRQEFPDVRVNVRVSIGTGQRGGEPGKKKPPR